MQIYKEFHFEAAHLLPNVPPGHKCARLHGHSFQVRLTASGDAPEPAGWVMDFAELKASFAPLHDELGSPLPQRNPRAGKSHQRKHRPLDLEQTETVGAALYPAWKFARPAPAAASTRVIRRDAVCSILFR